MVTPPPIIPPKSANRFPISVLIAGGLIFAAVVSAVLFWPPTVTEQDYLHGITENPVTLREIGFTGSIIAERDETLTLYTSDEQTPFYTSPTRILEIAGPNANGNLIIYEINQINYKYRIVLFDFNTGKARVISEGTSNPFTCFISRNIIFHPKQNRLFLFYPTGTRQYKNGYLSTGELVELNVNTQERKVLAKDVLDQPFSLSATHDKLFFSHSTSAPEPQITQLSLKTGQLTPFGPGWHTSITLDENSVLVYDRDRQPIRTINVSTGKEEVYSGPKLYFIPFSRLTESLFFGQSLALNRESVRLVPTSESVSGPRRLDRLGIFEPATGRASILRTDYSFFQSTSVSSYKVSTKGFLTPPVKGAP